MSDRRLRQLERDQSTEGWYRLLQERVRLGLEPKGGAHCYPLYLRDGVLCPGQGDGCDGVLDVSTCPYCADCHDSTEIEPRCGPGGIECEWDIEPRLELNKQDLHLAREARGV